MRSQLKKLFTVMLEQLIQAAIDGGADESDIHEVVVAAGAKLRYKICDT